jgi:DNA-3-methyladenine glycosylase I
VSYHDQEWGTPSRDDRHLFEMLVLEGAQAGLSWSTILHKREGYRAAFAGFDPDVVARFGPADVDRLMADAGIVRNRLKITSAIDNAQAVLAVREEAGGLAQHLWSFVGNRPIVGDWKSVRDIPAETGEARAMSRDLKARGFASLARPSAMRSCKASGWSTTT